MPGMVRVWTTWGMVRSSGDEMLLDSTRDSTQIGWQSGRLPHPPADPWPTSEDYGSFMRSASPTLNTRTVIAS